MNFKFYIFGTPHNFELYPNDKEETSQFQMYENNDSENVRFIIQRSKTQILYSYLHYHLVSYRKIQDAFFGMAIEFENEYCSENVKDLYLLFDLVFKKVILKNGILLKQTDKQVKFQNYSFRNKNVKNEIKIIEGIIRKNIEHEFINDFKPFNSQTFKLGINENLVAKIDIEIENDIILDLINEYPQLSLSPEYPQSVKTSPKKTQQQGSSLDNWIQNSNENLTAIKDEVNKNNETKVESSIKTNKNTKAKDVAKVETSREEKIEEVNASKEENAIPSTKNIRSGNWKELFKYKWFILTVVAGIATIWLIISIYNIVNLWVE